MSLPITLSTPYPSPHQFTSTSYHISYFLLYWNTFLNFIGSFCFFRNLYNLVAIVFAILFSFTQVHLMRYAAYFHRIHDQSGSLQEKTTDSIRQRLRPYFKLSALVLPYNIFILRKENCSKIIYFFSQNMEHNWKNKRNSFVSTLYQQYTPLTPLSLAPPGTSLQSSKSLPHLPSLSSLAR